MKPTAFAMFLAAAAALSSLAPCDEAAANGGGYVAGGVNQSGDLLGFEPKETQHIRILEEDLSVKLGPTSARVEVRYRMRNETEKEVTVRFGFPVEETGGGELFEDEEGNIDIEGIDPADLPPPHRELAYCRNYKIAGGGTSLEATWREETRGEKDPLFRKLVGWLVSEMTFAGGAEEEVRISFDSVYPKKVLSVSDDGHISPSLFKYRLSTAACWAGTIGKGRIVIEPDGIDPEEVRIIKPANRFRKEGQNWVWEFTDLEPTLADDFEIEAQPERSTYTRFDGDTPITYANRGDRWTLLHANYAIRASSTLAAQDDNHFAPENLKSWESWAEGAPGPGVGEWLELQPEVPKPLVAISFDPGIAGYEEESFLANARPKRVRLELNDEHVVTMDVPDSPEEFRYALGTYDKPVAKVRLTFEEVWPGSQTEDLGLSQLRLHVALDQKPEIRPAR